MRPIFFAFALSAILPACMNLTTGENAMPQETLGPSINTLIGSVQAALIDVQQEPLVKENLPGLKHVKLELNTGFDKEGKLKINLFFLEIGGGASASESQSIKLTMTPPSTDTPKAMLEKGPDKLTAQLSKLIKAAAEGVVGAGNSRIPLEATGLEIALKFGVTKKASGGASFDIAPVTVGVGGGVNLAQVQTIMLVFKD